MWMESDFLAFTDGNKVLTWTLVNHQCVPNSYDRFKLSLVLHQDLDLGHVTVSCSTKE